MVTEPTGAVRAPVAPGRAGAVDRWSALSVAALVVPAGLVLRFVARSPLWLDEALSVNIAALGPGEIVEALRHDGHPPLYYLLLGGWIRLFGTSEVAVRSLSGILSVVAWVAMVLWARRRRPEAVLPMAVVVGASPLAIRYATEARMYALGTALVAAGALAVDAHRRRARWWTAGAIAVVTGALLLTHYWAFHLLAAVGAGWVVSAVRARRGGRSARTALTALAAMAVGSTAFVPWLGVFAFQLAHTGTPWATAPRPTTLVATTLVDLGGVGDEGVLGALVIVVSALLGLTAVAVGPSVLELDARTRPFVRTEAALVAATFGIATVAGLVTGAAYQTRYATLVLPLVALVVAAGPTVSPRWVRTGLLVALAAFGLLGGIRHALADRTQGGEVVAAINGAASPGDVVVFCPDQLGPAFSRGLRTDVTAVVYPTLGPPDRVDWVDYEQRNRAARPAEVADRIRAMAADRTVWLVWRGGYRTLEGHCEALRDALAVGRTPVPVVLPRPVFEPATLEALVVAR